MYEVIPECRYVGTDVSAAILQANHRLFGVERRAAILQTMKYTRWQGGDLSRVLTGPATMLIFHFLEKVAGCCQ